VTTIGLAKALTRDRDAPGGRPLTLADARGNTEVFRSGESWPSAPRPAGHAGPTRGELTTALTIKAMRRACPPSSSCAFDRPPPASTSTHRGVVPHDNGAARRALRSGLEVDGVTRGRSAAARGSRSAEDCARRSGGSAACAGDRRRNRDRGSQAREEGPAAPVKCRRWEGCSRLRLRVGRDSAADVLVGRRQGGAQAATAVGERRDKPPPVAVALAKTSSSDGWPTRVLAS